MAKAPGVKSKYKDGIETIKIHPTIPKDKKEKCLNAIENIVEGDKRILDQQHQNNK